MTIKDWAEILAPTLALVGVVVTIHSASRTYRRGLAETRKDRQRQLLSEFISTTRELTALWHVSYPSLAHMKMTDLIEWVNTDSGKREHDLGIVFRNKLVQCLCEIRDSTIRPLLEQLDQQHTQLRSREGSEDLTNVEASRDARLKAARVALEWVGAIEATCNQLQLAAVEVLPVEIEVPSMWGSLRKWLHS